MRFRYFFLLLATSIAISIHLTIEGLQSRGVTQAIIEQSALADLPGVGFGMLMIILTGIQMVLLVLAHRIAGGPRTRLGTYACALLYLVASAFAYLGYLDLQSQILI
jgi:hypothetical protein